MSKKRTKNEKKQQEVQRETDEISEEALDLLARAMLTPETISLLLQDKFFVREALNETRKVKKDKQDIQDLGKKYNISLESIEQSLEGVEQIFTKILGDNHE